MTSQEGEGERDLLSDGVSKRGRTGGTAGEREKWRAAWMKLRGGQREGIERGAGRDGEGRGEEGEKGCC